MEARPFLINDLYEPAAYGRGKLSGSNFLNYDK